MKDLLDITFREIPGGAGFGPAEGIGFTVHPYSVEEINGRFDEQRRSVHEPTLMASFLFRTQRTASQSMVMRDSPVLPVYSQVSLHSRPRR